jgi:type I restriction-modification system DNA methylase subunit
MKSKKETFAEIMQTFSYRYDLRTAFDDFLTICLCTFSQNFETGKSHDEDLYMATIAKYTKDEERDTFPKMLAALILEMEDRVHDGAGNDVLGDFYETNLYRKGASQYFTPYPVCVFMSSCLQGDMDGSEKVGFRRILDPTCGSGRMLLAGATTFGRNNYFYGI